MDPYFIGLADHLQKEVAFKTVNKKDSEQRLGSVVLKHSKIAVVVWEDLTDKQRKDEQDHKFAFNNQSILYFLIKKDAFLSFLP